MRLIYDIMKRRRSIRKFKKDKFAIEKLCSIVKAGLLAPSAIMGKRVYKVKDILYIVLTS